MRLEARAAHSTPTSCRTTCPASAASWVFHRARGGHVHGSSPPPRRSERRGGPSNQLLRALSTADYAVVVPQLTRVALAAGELVSKSHARPRHVYFPETAVLSLIIDMENGSAVEAATVGNEGLAGLSAMLGDGAMSS